MTLFRGSPHRSPASAPGCFAGLALAFALGLGALGAIGCKDQSDPPPAATASTISATEVKRGQEACKAYVDKVCACARTVPAMAQSCELSRALPDALEVGLEVAESADSARIDVLQASRTARGIVKECIEQLAKLPAAGCRL
jgi:hypothetical protein